MCYVVGVAAIVNGGAASDVAADVARRVRLPLESGDLSLLPPARSPAQDAQAAGSSLVDGVCVCDVAAPRGAEADTLTDMV